MIAGLGLVILRDNYGFVWVAWLALVVIASDILGYFAGKIIGGPKFWPKVSPKKDLVGHHRGLDRARPWWRVAFVLLGHAGWQLVTISIAIAIAGQMGDVAESALKRRSGVKDSSNILPGHGGMFDRFDAMLGASLFLAGDRTHHLSFRPFPCDAAHLDLRGHRLDRASTLSLLRLNPEAYQVVALTGGRNIEASGRCRPRIRRRNRRHRP